MHEYDIALKSILMRRTGSLLTRITGLKVERWHNTEFPEVRNQRADLMGATAEGEFVHVELQSTNDSDMAQRMLEYSAAANRAFGRFPHQLVLYVGGAPARMGNHLSGPGISYEFSVFDIRELDSEVLLESPDLGDNIVAIPGRLAGDSVRRILKRIAENNPDQRARAISELMLLAGLRATEEHNRKGDGTYADSGRHHGSRSDWARAQAGSTRSNTRPDGGTYWAGSRMGEGTTGVSR